MTGPARAGLRRGLAAAGLLVVFAQPGPAQQTGANTATLTLTPGMTWDGGTDTEDTARAALGLGFSMIRQSRSSYFTFSASGQAEWGETNASSPTSNFTDRALRLGYGRDSRDTKFDLAFGYRQGDIDDLTLSIPLTQDVVVIDGGTVETYTGTAALEFGRTARFGGTLELGYGATVYSDTQRTDLDDRETASAAATLRFDIDDRIGARLVTSLSRSDRDNNGQDTDRTAIGAGLVLGVTKTLTAEIEAGRSEVITGYGPGTDSKAVGGYYTLSFTETRPDGAITGSLKSDLNDSGERRDTARLARRFELPAGTFLAGIGASQGENDNLRPLYDLIWRRELPRAALSASFAQGFTTSSDGDEALNSRLNLTYLQELSPEASVQAGLMLAATDYVGAGVDDTQRVDLSLAYRHRLTRDWDAIGSYAHSFSRDRGGDEEESGTVFLGLEKSFRWRY
ncbi:hypothetical protein RGUI_4191 (plasmid) [Rhodovulum sp. P5]|uniref:hypothetical protein n=1 Tax=Rhodovulum sp. P5 TaxID=1564506 RepID=UPI0009C1FA3E|nr:hypothetical protein [Rhodovulum sp. P5]ARE42508.1 hypothetical protein RGUI_4191 [Rhodovulum sp. P5]